MPRLNWCHLQHRRDLAVPDAGEGSGWRRPRSAKSKSDISLARRQLRMARVGDVVLLDHPADTTGPRSINCYLVEVPDFTATASGGAGAKRFKIDPQRLLYSLQ